jgi:hypothetical protein
MGSLSQSLHKTRKGRSKVNVTQHSVKLKNERLTLPLVLDSVTLWDIITQELVKDCMSGVGALQKPPPSKYIPILQTAAYECQIIISICLYTLGLGF